MRPIFVGMFAVDLCRRKGGIVLCWTHDISIFVKSYSMSHIVVVISDNYCGRNWESVGFYGDPVISTRHRSWRLLKQIN